MIGGIEDGLGDDPNAVNVAGILSHDYGSDGPGTTLLTADGAILPVGFTASVNAEGTVLTIHQVSTNLDVLQVSLSNTTDGSYTVTQLNSISHPAGGDENNLQFSINYVVTDGNGDRATGSFSIDVDDDTPTVSGNNLVQLDDDALTGGNPGGTGDDANAVNATGTLAHSYGADGAGTTLLSGTGAPAGFTYALSNGGQTLTISQDSTGLNVLQITLTNTADGSYAVSQLNPISHPVGSAENNVEFTVTYQVTDKDGDATLGTLSVNVDDDTPTRVAQAAPITATVLEAGLSTATGDAGDQSEGIRGPGETTDSDQAAGVAGSLTGLVSVGADAPVTFGLSSDTSGLPTLFSHGELLVYQVTGNVLTASSSFGTVFTLQVNANGSWSFDLDDQLDHVEGNGENLDLRTTADGSTSVGAIDFSSIILATDADGDSVNVLLPGDFTIAVRDDVPASVGETISRHSARRRAVVGAREILPKAIAKAGNCCRPMRRPERLVR